MDDPEEAAVLGEALVPGGGGSLEFQLVDLEAAKGTHLWGRPLSPKEAMGPGGQWGIQVKAKIQSVQQSLVETNATPR